jgi:hypothetical protein
MFHIYNIADFEITHEPKGIECLTNLRRAGNLRDASAATAAIEGLAENYWHILTCGDPLYKDCHLYSFEFAIIEHFTNQIYKLALGYSADVLIVYDQNAGIFHRASRNIEQAQPWRPQNVINGNYLLHDPIDAYQILPDGSLVNKEGQIKNLFGYAAISIVSFLVGDGDVHPEQYLLQHLPQLKVWKIDNQGSFAANYPVSIDNLELLPHFKSVGYLKRFNMHENISPYITESSAFKQEKVATLKMLYNAHTDLRVLLHQYCTIENYDLAALRKIFTADEMSAFQSSLSEIEQRFAHKLNRFIDPAVEEYIRIHAPHINTNRLTV